MRSIITVQEFTVTKLWKSVLYLAGDIIGVSHFLGDFLRPVNVKPVLQSFLRIWYFIG